MIFSKKGRMTRQEFKEFVHNDDDLNKKSIFVFQHFNNRFIYHYIDIYYNHHLKTFKNKKKMLKHVKFNENGNEDYYFEIIEKNFLKENPTNFLKLVSKLYT